MLCLHPLPPPPSRHATGDEEVSGAGHLKGIILEREIPHLSHLGVRARQERVVFVTSEQQETLGSLRKLVGQRVSLFAGAEGAQVGPVAQHRNQPVSVPVHQPTSLCTSL